MKRIYSLLLSVLAGQALAQSPIVFDFDDGKDTWLTRQGVATITEQGAYKGKALKLAPHTAVAFKLALQPSSTYRVTAWMHTESGADDMTMQLDGLGDNNISASTALTAWTKTERTFNVSPHQSSGTLEFVFENSQGNTSAWVDEVTVQRIGDYKEVVYTGIPEAPKRETKTDMGVAMQPDGKIQWMLDGKLGLFIHWGIYAGPAKGEWYMENAGIAPEEYRKYAYPEAGDMYFDAKDFDAEKWVALAKRMGATYMCMTTQHHDGYALFDSKYMNAFTSKQTLNRDFVKEYVEACRQAGLRVGLYKTLINWRYPGYYDVTGTDCKPNKFGYQTDPAHKENARLMKEELFCLTKELMTGYGKIDQVFWDGGWLAQQGSDRDAAYFWEPGELLDPHNPWPVNPYFQDKDSMGRALGIMGMVRKYQPDIVVNVRSGWIGDYENEEGGGPVKGPVRSGVVEKCFTLTPGWGYTATSENPASIMPLRNIKRIFADCIVRNMCCLINVGPDRHGNIPQPVAQRLTEFGDWVDTAKEAIYGTRGGPWQPSDGRYGFCYKGDTVFVYFMGGYTNSSLTLPPLNRGMKVKKAYDVVTGRKVGTSQKGTSVTLKDLSLTPDDLTVIAIVLNKQVR